MRSRPGSPPSEIAIVQQPSPQRSNSADTVSSSGASDTMLVSPTSKPTNTLIITPLPVAFFEPKILEALRSHFASYSETFVHRTSRPYSDGPGANISSTSTSPTTTKNKATWEEYPEGDLYSWVPLKGLRRAIVVYYTSEEAERARLASDKLYIPATARSHAVTLRAFRGANTTLVPDSLISSQHHYDPEIGYMDDSDDDDTAIRESPFHLRPPVPERNFLISPPGSPPVGWVAVQEEPPNEVTLAEDLQLALERLQRQRQQLAEEDDLEEDEEGILLIPESEGGVCVRVQNWSHRRRNSAPPKKTSQDDDMIIDQEPRVDWSDGQFWNLERLEADLDEDLDDGRFGRPSWRRKQQQVNKEDNPVDEEAEWQKRYAERAKKNRQASQVSPKPASLPPLPISAPSLAAGLMTPSGQTRIQPTARPPIQ